jgi:hypothetical protein
MGRRSPCVLRRYTVATLEGWLNTSKDKDSVWVKHKDTNGFIKDNVFVNLESKDALAVLVTILREAFAKKVSYEVIVNIEDIQRSKGGSLFVKSTLDEVLESMTEAKRAESAPVDPKSLAKAQALLAELAKREVAEVTSSESDDILSF